MNPLAAFEKQLIPEEEIARLMQSGDKTPEEMMAYINQIEVPYIWQPAIEAAADKDIKAARSNSNAMIELVMVDKAQKPFKQERAHIRIQELLMRTFESGLRGRISPSDINELRNLLLEMPFESGKTQQLVGFMLWLFGQDQGITGAYVREAHDDACAIVGQVAAIIHLNENYKAIFPEVKLQSRDKRDIPGKKRAFTLERKGQPADPTLTAGGMDQAPEGKRWDFAIIDDPSTFKTAFSQAYRERGDGVFRYAIKSRLDKNYGFWVMIGQERHPEDVIARSKTRERYNHVHEPIMTNMDDYSTCQFPRMYSESAIEDLKRDMTSFLTYYMLQPHDPEEQDRKRQAIIRAIKRAENEGHIWYEIFQPRLHQFVSVGVDLPVKKLRKGGKEADNLTCYVETYDPLTGDNITLSMRMQKAGWYEIIDFLVAVCRDFGLLLPGPRILVVENVAAQDFVIQAFNDPVRGIIKRCPEFRNLRIEPYTTNQQTKLYDIPAVMNGYHNGKEILPDSPLTQSYIAGVLAWTPGDHPHDLLMARVCSDHGIEILREKYKNMYTEGICGRSNGDRKRFAGDPPDRDEHYSPVESYRDPGTAAVVSTVY